MISYTFVLEVRPAMTSIKSNHGMEGIKLENDYHTIIRKNLMTKIHLEKSLQINYRLVDVVRIHLKRELVTVYSRMNK